MSVADSTARLRWRAARGVVVGAVVLLVGTLALWASGQSGAVSAAPPPPPPPPLTSAPPGTHPIWPVSTTLAGAGSRTATEVARDFAERLGISDPTVSEPPSVSASGIGTVTISLPTGDRPLAAFTQRQVDGNWAIIQVGDQSRMQGITMLPDGKPGPVMTIHPPASATSGDVSEVASDGTHQLHLTADDLRAGVVHLFASRDPSLLPGALSIYTVLIVYRDSRNGVVDALGGEFG